MVMITIYGGQYRNVVQRWSTTEARFVQRADPHLNQGASLLSLVELGKEKDYELVAILPFNAFFVESKYYPLFDINNNALEKLRKDLSFIT